MFRTQSDSSWNISDESNMSKDRKSKAQNTLKKYTKKGKKQIEKKKKFGHWNVDENLRYLTFLKLNKEHFQQSEQRKIWKIYKAMSIYVESRDIYQCRSHHQKMLEKYYCVNDLILDLSRCYQQDQIEKLTNITPIQQIKKNNQSIKQNNNPQQNNNCDNQNFSYSDNQLIRGLQHNGQNMLISYNYNPLINIYGPYPYSMMHNNAWPINYQQNIYQPYFVKKEQ